MFKKTRVKILQSTDCYMLEEMINHFLIEKKAKYIDLKYSSGEGLLNGNRVQLYSAVLIYSV